MAASAEFRGRAGWTIWIAAIAVAGFIGSLAVWDPLDTDERAHIGRLTDQTLTSVCADLDADVRSHMLALVRLAELWGWEEATQSLSDQEWTLNTRLFLDHHPSELQLEWLDAEQRPHWMLRRDSGPQLVTAADAPVARSLGDILVHALQSRPPSAAISTSFRLPNGRWGMRVAVPVMRNDEPLGFLVAVSDVQSALDTMLLDHQGLGYSFSVRDSSQTEIYRSPRARAEDERQWAHDAVLSLPGTSWRVRVWPTAELRKDVRSSLPELAGVMGGLLGGALLLTMRMGYVARKRSTQLHEAHAKLEDRVRQRTFELQRSNDDLEAQVERRTRAEESLRGLSGRLLRLQDDERRRIARELHDGTTQTLSAVAISLERAAQLVGRSGEGPLSKLLQESIDHLDEAMREIRTVGYLLHPPILDELGLEGAVRWYAQGFSDRSGIQVDVRIPDGLGRLPNDVELTFFRIVQEALTNVHRHSGSPTAAIILIRDSSAATLEIIDQGRGIPPSLLEPEGVGAAAAVGVGLAGMRERVRQLHGVLSIRATSSGTSIRVVLPVSDDSSPAGPGDTAS